MARLNLTCRCGWVFTVSDAVVQTHREVACPSCGGIVNLQASPRKASPASAPVAGGDRKKIMKLALVVSGAALAAAVLVIVLLASGGDDESESERSNAPAAGTAGDPTVKEKPGAGLRVKPADPLAPAGTGGAVQPPKPPPPEPSKPGQTSSKPDLPELPAAVLGSTRTEILTLKQFYLSLVAPGPARARLDRLASTGRGTVEDAEFLQGLLNGEPLRIVREEVADIEREYSELEGQAPKELPADRLLLANGEAKEGNILEDTAEGVKLETWISGIRGIRDYKGEEIKSRQKGAGAGGEFQKLWKAAPGGGQAEQLKLLAWCKEKSLGAPGKLVALLILKGDPGNATARSVAELPPDPVKAEVEGAALGPKIDHQGRKVRAKTLKEKLLRDGYLLHQGEWYQPRDKWIAVLGLPRYQKQSDQPVRIAATGGIGFVEECEVSWTHPGNGQESQVRKPLRWFFGPILDIATEDNTSLPPKQEVRGGIVRVTTFKVDKAKPRQGEVVQGEVTLTMNTGAPVIDGTITTLAEVGPGSDITVYFNKDGERLKIFQAAPKESRSHPLPPAVRGRQELQFVVVVTARLTYNLKNEDRQLQRGREGTSTSATIPERRVSHDRLIPQFHTVLFPSNSNTIQVFQVKLRVGEKLEALTKRFIDAGAMDYLKAP